ncbi:MAG: glycosyltransferase N-terminal domain-containing protein [Bacteroidota bacterium]
MGLFLYNLIFIRGYSLAIALASAFNKKARLFRDGRKNLFNDLKLAFHENDKPVFWLHAASLGEFEQGRPVMEAFRQQFPGHRILLTFYSPSGYEVRKNYNGADDVFYLPVDTKGNASRFLDIVKPDIAVFVKYEFWYHYISQSLERGVHFISISTILRPGHFLLSGRGKFLAIRIKGINHFFTQDTLSADLLGKLSIDQLTIAGDTRYDRVADIAAQAKEIPIVDRFLDGKEAIIIGSSWSSDMEKLIPVIEAYKEDLKFVIAPHNINEQEIAGLGKELKVSSVRYSDAQNRDDLDSFSVLIIDNIGMLSSLYKYGKYAYIGGAFRGALHNTLEAAVYGVPVFFGKHDNNHKFREAIDLIDNGGGFQFDTSEELIALIKDFQENADSWQKAGDASRNQVENSRGATAKIMNYLEEIIQA